MTSETWRVVLDDGTSREVVVWSEREHAWTCGLGSELFATARSAVLNAADVSGMQAAEILTPGQMTRAEALLAATDLGAEAMREAAVRACVTQASEMATTAGALGCDFCAEAIEDLPLPTAPTLAPAAGPSTCDAPFDAEAPHG